MYGVDLPHLTWRDYAVDRRDIADDEIRIALLLGPRPVQAVEINRVFISRGC